MATNTVDVLAMMEEEDRKAESRPTGTFVPTFLRLKDRQQARVRPLSTLDGMLVLYMHSKYNKADNKFLNAVCSSEIGEECLYCEAAKGDKVLTKTRTFFLPIYVSVVEEKIKEGGREIWKTLTYKDKEEKEHEVSGLRLLELKRFGTINQVLNFIRKLNQEDDEHDIRRYGLIIERVGGDQTTSYTTIQKGPGPMPEVARQLIPTLEAVRQMVFAAYPPAGTSVSAAPIASGPSAKEKKEDFDF